MSKSPGRLLTTACILALAVPLQPETATALQEQTPPPAPAPVDTAEAALVVDYPIFNPVVPPPGYRRALLRGTRSEDGRPGLAYWQQSVHYRIRGRLLPEEARLEGEEEVLYVNHSPDTLGGLLVHLYQNVFAPGVPRNRHVGLTGGIEISDAKLDGGALRELTQADLSRTQLRQERPRGYRIQGTLAQIFPGRAIVPGDTVRLAFDWSFRVPDRSEGFRMGHIDREVYNIAQWYPQIATYDDVGGYHAEPYLGDGEFYLEYGSFDVEITVPEGWLVTATGTLQNPEEVLRPEILRRLEGATASDSTIRIVTPDDRENGRATVTGAEGRLTWRFRAERVRDFAFATSSRYVWDAVGAEVGGELGRTRVDALYDPSLSHWQEAARYSKHAVEFFSRRIVPYPYPHASAAYGPVGGMEYPMLVFIGRSQPGEPLYSVLAHEFSHQWFPMMVGSNEAAYAWMDEGLTTFNESLARAAFFGNEDARAQNFGYYRRAVQFDVEAPLMEHTDHVESAYGRQIAAYQKPAVVLHALRHLLGAETFHRAYTRYAEAWTFRHPTPWDFFAIFEEEAGRDLDWFWQSWFFETAVLDQAIESVEPTPEGARITVSNRGGAVMPVDLQIELRDGSTRSVRWPAEIWAGTRRVSRVVELEEPAVRIRLDPGRSFPDLDDSNDVWESPSAAEETSDGSSDGG